MIRITGYINVYRSGYYRRAGRPHAFDRHAGDIYPSLEAALDEIDPGFHYVGTAQITWEEETPPNVNSRGRDAADVQTAPADEPVLPKTENKNGTDNVLAKIRRALNRPV